MDFHIYIYGIYLEQQHRAASSGAHVHTEETELLKVKGKKQKKVLFTKYYFNF